MAGGPVSGAGEGRERRDRTPLDDAQHANLAPKLGPRRVVHEEPCLTRHGSSLAPMLACCAPSEDRIQRSIRPRPVQKLDSTTIPRQDPSPAVLYMKSLGSTTRLAARAGVVVLPRFAAPPDPAIRPTEPLPSKITRATAPTNDHSRRTAPPT